MPRARGCGPVWGPLAAAAALSLAAAAAPAGAVTAPGDGCDVSVGVGAYDEAQGAWPLLMWSAGGQIAGFQLALNDGTPLDAAAAGPAAEAASFGITFAGGIGPVVGLSFTGTAIDAASAPPATVAWLSPAVAAEPVINASTVVVSGFDLDALVACVEAPPPAEGGAPSSSPPPAMAGSPPPPPTPSSGDGGGDCALLVVGDSGSRGGGGSGFEILIQAGKPIAGFQFSLAGGQEIASVEAAGAAKDNDFTVSTGGTGLVIGLALHGSTIDATGGPQVVAVVEVAGGGKPEISYTDVIVTEFDGAVGLCPELLLAACDGADAVAVSVSLDDGGVASIELDAASQGVELAGYQWQLAAVDPARTALYKVPYTVADATDSPEEFQVSLAENRGLGVDLQGSATVTSGVLAAAPVDLDASGAPPNSRLCVTDPTFVDGAQEVLCVAGAAVCPDLPFAAPADDEAEPSPPPPDGGGGGLSTGAIVGIVVGSVAGAAVLAAVGYYVFVGRGGGAGAASAVSGGSTGFSPMAEA